MKSDNLFVKKYENTDKASLVRKHQASGFSLAFYLVGGNQDSAYSVAVQGFSEALQKDPATFLTNALASTLERCREIKTEPSFEFGPGGKSDSDGALRIVRVALQSLPFDDQALLILRDQLNLGYGDIAKIMRLAPSEVRHRTISARGALRKSVEQALRLA